MTTSTTIDRSPGGGRARRGGSGRHWRFGLVLGVMAATAMPIAALAQTTDTTEGQSAPESTNYVTTTTAAERSLDVSGFSPECIRDAPFVRYTIVPVGFTPVGTGATLVVSAADGTVIETLQVTNLSGQFIWPGATVDAAGNATDWPGWKLADDGVSWIPDPNDAFLREGLSIAVTLDPPGTATVTYPTATATVSYVPSTSVCANPPEGSTPTTTPAPTTTVCVPGQNNDGNPADDCELASTGGGPSNALIIGAGALLAGLLFLTAARRRRNDGISTEAS
ncbi:MAG: LPXTG cell wall anchor domain-containing protein [Ilumatobacteraceae bacterium]